MSDDVFNGNRASITSSACMVIENRARKIKLAYRSFRIIMRRMKGAFIRNRIGGVMLAALRKFMEQWRCRPYRTSDQLLDPPNSAYDRPLRTNFQRRLYLKCLPGSDRCQIGPIVLAFSPIWDSFLFPGVLVSCRRDSVG
jgi:hypothetical protein